MSEKIQLAKAYVQIVPSAQGIKGSISDVLDGEAKESGIKAGHSIASSIKKMILTAGIGKALQSTIMEGANLEQSIGGIETLFKESADKVKEYAKVAYKTAGVSANKYMEQVTSFSASLLQSLDGDTDKAVESANRAIMDMSDNSNKMGTSIEMIQNAYQGFARGNYTMLDNLKLGYSGTKTEMERLLKDAEKLSGVKYDISSLSDVYEAIHVIQEEMGITGTTAKEASETVSGSFKAMSSSISNLMGSMALGEDIKPSLQALMSTTSTFLFDNLLPMIGNVVMSIPQILEEAVPTLITKGVEMLSSLAKGFAIGYPNFISKWYDILQNLANWLSAQAPILIEKGFEMLSNLVKGIVDTIPIMIQKLPLIISTFANIINDNFPTILKKGAELLVQFVKGILSAIPTLIQNIPQIIRAIVDTILAYNWLNLGKSIIDFFGKGIKSMTKWIESKGTEVATSIWNSLTHLPQTLWNLGKSMINKLGASITNTTGTVKGAIKGIFDVVVNGVKNLPSKMLSIGKDLVKGLWNGITSMGSWISDKITGFGNGIIESAKNIFGIHSPSRVFRDEVGKYLSLGLAEGITENMKPVDDAVEKLNTEAMGLIDTNIDVTTKSYSSVKGDEYSSIIDMLLMIIEDDKNKDHLLNRLYALLVDLLPQLANMQLVTDTGAIVGELALPMDERLGTINRRKER